MQTRTMTLRELVETAPQTAAVLAYHRIEPNGQTLTEAAGQAGLTAGELSAALDLAVRGGRLPWQLSPSELIDDILATHHAYLRQALPAISDLLIDAIGRTNGSAVFNRLAGVFTDLRGELELHMMKEEQVLFPMIRQLAAGQAITFGCGHVGGPITQMELEHASAMEALSRIDQLIGDGLADQAGAAPAGQALCSRIEQELARLSADLRLHIYKENQVLFPGAAALGQSQVA